MLYPDRHHEVVAALAEFGHPRSSEAIRKDRRSLLEYLAVSSPDVRRVAKSRFSFSSLPPTDILATWDDLWRNSPYGEVLFAAIEYYLGVVRKGVPSELWDVVKHWTGRVDNWSHCDTLSALFSRILEAYHEDVYPQIEVWNSSSDLWLRRISLVSLIHYSGKNAVFLPPERVLPLVSNCLSDDRYYVQKAVGWVLREMGHVYGSEIRAYLEANARSISAMAFSRSIERLAPEDRDQLRQLRKSSVLL